MSYRSRTAVYVFFAILALALALVAVRVPVSVAQESEPATSSTLTAGPALAAPAAIPPGGPGFFSRIALDLQPYPSQTIPYSIAGRTFHNPDTSSHAYEASVSLPHNATITKFVVWYSDNSANNLWAVIGRGGLDDSSVQQIARVDSTDAAPGIRFLEDTTILTPVVDNRSYMYWIEVFLPPNSTAGVLSFRIDYQYPGYMPLVIK